MKELLKIRMPNYQNRLINSFQTYKLYILLTTHFKKNYDVIKYNWGSLHITKASYEKRKDKMFFDKLSKTYTIQEQIVLYISNLLANSNYWSGSLISIDSIDFYRQYKMRYESIRKCFESDLVNLCLFCNTRGIKFNKLLEVNDNKQPIIFKLLQHNVLSYETFILIDSAIPFIDNINNILDDIVWNNYSKRITSYKKLLDINEEEVKNMLLYVVKENLN